MTTTDLPIEQTRAAVANIDPFVMKSAFQRGYAMQELVRLPMPEEVFADICLRENALFEELREATDVQTMRLYDKKPSCGVGCHYCCFQTFEPSTVEVIAIACYLVAEDGVERVAQKARERVEKVTKLSKHDRYAAYIACPALESRNCSIYPVRPRTCRTYYSMSRIACQRDFRLKGKAPKSPGDRKKAGVPIIAEPGVIGSAIGFGVDLAFLRHGFEVDRVEFTAALDRVLVDPQASIAAWLAGENVFDGVPRPPGIPGTIEYPELLLRLAEQFDLREAKLKDIARAQKMN